MQTSTQRQLRNDNAEIVRAVESGESFTVTKNGRPVAVIGPVGEARPGLPLARAASRPADYSDWERVRSTAPTEDVLAALREER